MSHDFIQIISHLDLKRLETQVALQCAPLLSGLKLSNLLTVPQEDACSVEEIFRETDISCCLLRMTGGRAAFLLYREEELYEYLESAKVRELLQDFGYHDSSRRMILDIFKERYIKYMKDGLSFPHEIGLFLGYPLEDVKGFIDHQGKNFMYSGYWKVYSHLAETQRLFAEFDRAKERLIHLAVQGMSIFEILEVCNCRQTAEIAV